MIRVTECVSWVACVCVGVAAAEVWSPFRGASRVDQWDVEVRHRRHPLGEGVVSALAQLQVEVRGQLPANLVVDGHGVDVVHLRRIQAQVVEFVDRLGVDDELEVPRA